MKTSLINVQNPDNTTGQWVDIDWGNNQHTGMSLDVFTKRYPKEPTPTVPTTGN